MATSYDPVHFIEANDRHDRILSVACPRCGAPPGKTCKNPGGKPASEQHGARWDALYRSQS